MLTFKTKNFSLLSKLFYFMIACFPILEVKAQDNSKLVQKVASEAMTEKLRSTLFKQSLQNRSCLTINNSLQNGADIIDKDLKDFLTKLSNGFESRNASELLPLFHPKILDSLIPIKELLSAMRITLGPPFEVSTYRLWAINTVDGDPSPVTCQEQGKASLKFWPQFGYNLEFAIWLQILGQKELGRIFATIVNKEGHWYIGALHYHQWTHAGKDFEHWVYEGQKDLRDDSLHSAFIKFDIASKLVYGKKQFELDAYGKINELQAQTLSRKQWENDLRSTLKDWKIIYLSTILAKNGAGLIFRIEIPKEISTKDLINDCHKLGSVLARKKWFSRIDGYKCSYVIKGEDPTKEGRSGGIFVKTEKILKLPHSK